MTSPGIITLLTDFGLDDPYVGIMKGVILSANPTVRLVDLTHAIAAQDVLAGAMSLRSAVPYFPSDCIHLAVVDPGVGSARAALVVETTHGWLVGPDNGLLSLVGERRRVWRIENQALWRHPVSRTFHGRDVFAPIAAYLSLGGLPESVGPLAAGIHELRLPEVTHHPDSIEGEVIHVDHFGNLVTNIDAVAIAAFHAAPLSTSVAGMTGIGLVTAYTKAAPGTLLAIIGSSNVLEIALRDGSAARHLGAGKGSRVSVRVVS